MYSKDNIEMKEIKAPKRKGVKEFFGRHIIVIYLVVILAILLFGNIAKAEECNYNFNSLEDGLNNIVGLSQTKIDIIVSTFEQYCPYYQFYYDPTNNCLGANGSDMPHNYVVGMFVDSSPWHIGGLWFLAPKNTTPSYSYKLYVSGNNVYLVRTNSGSSGSWYTMFNEEFYNSYGVRFSQYQDNGITPIINNSVTTRFTKNNTYYFVMEDYDVLIQNNYGNVRPLGKTPTDFDPTSKIKYITPINYTEDSRLKFSLINDTFDGKVLMTDIRQFVSDFPIQDTSHSSIFLDPASITLTYTVGSTEKTITLNSTNSSIRSKYIFETPIYYFDFDDDNTDVIITKADFTISGTSQSSPFSATETYKISCNYPIRQLTPLPIPTPIPDPTYNDVETNVSDPATVLQEITIQLTNDSTTTNAFTGEWTLDQTHPTVPTWADNYDFRVIKSDFNSIISGIVNADIWNYYTTNDPNDYDWITGGFNPRNFVDENRNFAFYDMIIISVYEANVAWDPDNVGTNLIYQNIHLLGYITLYSQRYYVHKAAITDSNILATLEYSSMNDVAFYETIKAAVDQFEEYTLGRFDASLDIEKDSLSWLKTIDNSIKAIDPFDDSSILNVLDNIYDAITGWGGTDTSRIETKLDTLINHFIANNSQENTAYKRFVTWLRDANSKPVQYVTTGYEFFTELFDYFPFTRDLDGSGGFANMFDMGKGFIDLSTGHTTGIPENYQGLSYYFNSANDGTYNVSSMSGR